MIAKNVSLGGVNPTIFILELVELVYARVGGCATCVHEYVTEQRQITSTARAILITVIKVQIDGETSLHQY